MYFNIASYVTLFGGGLCLLMALEQIIRRKPSRLNYLLFALSFCNSIVLFGIWVMANRVYAIHPLGILLFMTAVLAVGPLNLIHYNSLLNPLEPLPLRLLIHLIPATFVFSGDVVLQFFAWEYKVLIVNNLLSSPTDSFLTPFMLLAGAYTIVYLSYLLKIEMTSWSLNEINKRLIIIIVSDSNAIISVVLLFAGLFMKNREIFITSGVIITIIKIVMFITNTKYADFFRLFKRENGKQRCEKSILLGVDTRLIHNRLMELMSTEGLYRDYDISIEDVAEKLSITPHQLSRFLNANIKMEFRNFINKYRVDEAKRLLESDNDHCIISICFHVGFSSKSAFNNAFKRFTGMTPRDYRNSILSDEKFNNPLAM